MRRTDPSGFTLVELMIVIAIIGVLANLAIPNMIRMTRRADAITVIKDFEAVRDAAFSHYAQSGTFPATDGWGDVPPSMAAHLPPAFSFNKSKYNMRWVRWSLPNGNDRRGNQPALMALRVRSSDRDLIRAVQDQYNGPMVQATRTRVTYVGW